MNLTISPLIRIVIMAGVVVIVALGGVVMLLGRSHKVPAAIPASQRHGSATRTKATVVHTKTHVVAKTPKTVHVKTVHVKTVHVKTAVPHKAGTMHKATTTHKAATTHKVVTVKRTPIRHTKAGYRGNPVYADLPAPLQWQLAHHKVVVVSFYNPNATVDGISVAEAHAGATEANAGFLLVSVLDNKVAGILTALLPGGGLLPEPGVIVYRAPGTISVRMDGFADRDTVFQAATNAIIGTPTTTTTTPTTTTP